MTASIDRQIEEVLSVDPAGEVEQISSWIRNVLRKDLHKRGLVIGISGGVDSAVCTALAVRAVGAARVFGLLMPERDSSSGSVEKGRMLVDLFGIAHLCVDITATLEAIGCYRWRDEAMRRVFPSHEAAWKSKIAISGGTDGRINHFNLVVEDTHGRLEQKRLGVNEYLQIVAATNFKQRVRKTLEYFHADRLNYAVVGTPNRVEFDQGFFVRNGDGSADLKPIAHLYKSQVYRLARHLGLPESICSSAPSTDTYSLVQGQDEFYFALPYREMDLALWHFNQHLPATTLAQRLGVDVAHAEFIYRDMETKRRTTSHLHWPALLVKPVDGPRTHAPAPTAEAPDARQPVNTVTTTGPRQ
jgi:NAD+ synthase